MVIKVASDNGYFLSIVRFGNFRSIIAQTSNGWCCAGSFWLRLLIAGGCRRSSESRGRCRSEVSLVIVSVFLVSLFPRVKDLQVIHTTLLSLGYVLGPVPFAAIGVTLQKAVSSLVT